MPPHPITGNPLHPPFPPPFHQAAFALGCFWGAERLFWQLPGIHTTAAGYCGGTDDTRAPTYPEICTGTTGHAETVLVVHDPTHLPYTHLLRTFWQSHNPTQGNRQGNDRGPQYRSIIFTFTSAQRTQAQASKTAYQARLQAAGHPPITTEILPAAPFHYAEPEHQQYLARHPNGYCGLTGTGIPSP